MNRVYLSAFTFFFCVHSIAVRAETPWIIDPHTHFKGREQIAHENKTVEREPLNTLGHVVVPEDYRKVAARLGIQSTLVVEAVDQDQPQFNDWLLDQAKSDLVCGYVARGDLAQNDFQANYDRYKKTGYLNGFRFRFDELAAYLENETARKNLAILEQDGMVVDLLIEPSHAADVVKLAEAFPQLKIVINHCFRASMEDGEVSDEWKSAVATCAKFENVHMKISSIVNFAGTKPFIEQAPSDLKTYLPVLEPCFAAFGEDRVIFATNWGVCTHFGSVDDVVRIVTEFLQSKGDTALRKGMRDNAIRVYGIDNQNLDSIRGVWTVVSSEGENGTAQQQMKNAKVEFTATHILLTATSGQTVKMSYKLDPSKTPMTIDTVHSRGENPVAHRGIYDISRNELRLCLAVTPRKRPDQFDAKLGMLHLLRRVPEEH